MTMEKRNIFVDMDGVLVDFERGFVDRFGISVDDAYYRGDMWDLINSSDRVFGSTAFWENLPPMPDYRELWDFIKNENVSILTGCPHKRDRDGGKILDVLCPFTRYGKFYWILNNIGYSRDIDYLPVFSEDKWSYAKSGSILIDDREDLCEQWEANTRGAIAVYHKSAADTIQKLKQIYAA